MQITAINQHILNNNNFVNFKSRYNRSRIIYTSNTVVKDIFQKNKAPKPTYDTFTGLKDKNTLLIDLATLLKKSKDTNSTVRIAMFDMDNFKSINEVLGYTTGDEFIKTISKEVNNAAKEANLDAYRYGGEEFIILFPNRKDLSDKKVADICENIQQRLKTNTILAQHEQEYIDKIDSKSEEFKQKTSELDKIYDFITFKKVIGELGEVDTSVLDNENVIRLMKTKKTDATNQMQNLIKKSIETEIDIDQRSKLQEALNNDEDITENSEILEYLDARFNKTFDAYRYKKWKSDFNKNNGFGITGCIKSLDPKKCKSYTPTEIIEMIGTSLTNDKQIQKGHVYSEI